MHSGISGRTGANDSIFRTLHGPFLFHDKLGSHSCSPRNTSELQKLRNYQDEVGFVFPSYRRVTSASISSLRQYRYFLDLGSSTIRVRANRGLDGYSIGAADHSTRARWMISSYFPNSLRACLFNLHTLSMANFPFDGPHVANYTFGSLFWGRAAAGCGLCKAPASCCVYVLLYPRNLEFDRSIIKYENVVTAGPHLVCSSLSFAHILFCPYRPPNSSAELHAFLISAAFRAMELFLYS